MNEQAPEDRPPHLPRKIVSRDLVPMGERGSPGGARVARLIGRGLSGQLPRAPQRPALPLPQPMARESHPRSP